MTRIDFYQLDSARYHPDKLVCSLCQKAFQSNQKVLLLTEDQQQSDKFDRLLWTHDDESFLPHDQQEQDDFTTPVLVNHESSPRGERELLINLSHEIPIYFAQFERVIELVTSDNKATSREHYIFYRERGYELNHHKI